MAKKKKKKHKKKHEREALGLAPPPPPLAAEGGTLPTEIAAPAGAEKITLRHLGARAAASAEPISGKEIRVLRERAHLSQAVLARYLNLTVGYISQLERGAKRASGPALVLLDLIRRKGIEAIL
jgi:putative transcriptional regulator